MLISFKKARKYFSPANYFQNMFEFSTNRNDLALALVVVTDVCRDRDKETE